MTTPVGASSSSTFSSNKRIKLEGPVAYVPRHLWNSKKDWGSVEGDILSVLQSAGITPLGVGSDEKTLNHHQSKHSHCLISVLDSAFPLFDFHSLMRRYHDEPCKKRPIFVVDITNQRATRVAQAFDSRIDTYIRLSGGALFTGPTATQDLEAGLKEWVINWEEKPTTIQRDFYGEDLPILAALWEKLPFPYYQEDGAWVQNFFQE